MKKKTKHEEKCAFEESEFKCSALNVKKCAGCTFYKTEEQLYIGRKKAERRLKKLAE